MLQLKKGKLTSRDLQYRKSTHLGFFLLMHGLLLTAAL